jgi:hypothetical protein
MKRHGAQVAAAALALAACSTGVAGVGHYDRPPGMPIGTGATSEERAAREARALLAEGGGEASDNRDVAIPRFEQTPERPPPATVPCAGCVELQVDVSDINQRDEFAFDARGARITRVVWTLLVSFNSDQLAVQPFVDKERGKYTALHVNTFPLGAPVQVEQIYSGSAQQIGLVVGSSGAWTGNQTMSVFVDAVSVEGPGGFQKSFAADAEGLEARTHEHRPHVVAHAFSP